MNRSFWKGKNVLITGHTGFKGGWLALWLKDMGAIVHGISLEPPTIPNFFSVINLKSILDSHTICDIRNFNELSVAIKKADPEIVFHMAAQPLVRDSYTYPLETYSTNIMGTLNVLEILRSVSRAKAVINITTDKCYENKETGQAYQETDPLGGHDPYSNSKACAELVSSAYRSSFYSNENKLLATARAGNVIGGGDWAKDRLIPDFFRALDKSETLLIRSPNSIRPWQHVLEPISGYLRLAEALFTHGKDFASAWNFGPEDSDTKPVKWLLDYLCSEIDGAEWGLGPHPDLHEAKLLRLDISKSKTMLNWKPSWSLDVALTKTYRWHEAWKNKVNMTEFSLNQIKDYEKISQ